MKEILKRMFGLVKINDQYRLRHNVELYQIYREPNVVQFIRLSRLRWAGQIASMDGDSPIKRLLFGYMDGRRKRGRPRLRWADEVEADAGCRTLELGRPFHKTNMNESHVLLARTPVPGCSACDDVDNIKLFDLTLTIFNKQ